MYPVYGASAMGEAEPVPPPPEAEPAIVQYVPDDSVPDPEPIPPPMPAAVVEPPTGFFEEVPDEEEVEPPPVVASPFDSPALDDILAAHGTMTATVEPVVSPPPEEAPPPTPEQVVAAEDIAAEQNSPEPDDSLAAWASKLGIDEKALAKVPVVSDDELMKHREKYFSTAEAAEFFDKSNQWLYWGMRNEIFLDMDGKAIEPILVGKGKRRRFTLEIIEAIALACHRRGNMNEDELKVVLRKILIAKHGLESFDEDQKEAVP